MREAVERVLYEADMLESDYDDAVRAYLHERVDAEGAFLGLKARIEYLSNAAQELRSVLTAVEEEGFEGIVRLSKGGADCIVPVGGEALYGYTYGQRVHVTISPVKERKEGAVPGHSPDNDTDRKEVGSGG